MLMLSAVYLGERCPWERRIRSITSVFLLPSRTNPLFVAASGVCLDVCRNFRKDGPA
jgi:hypothetical protein